MHSFNRNHILIIEELACSHILRGNLSLTVGFYRPNQSDRVLDQNAWSEKVPFRRVQTLDFSDTIEKCEKALKILMPDFCRNCALWLFPARNFRNQLLTFFYKIISFGCTFICERSKWPSEVQYRKGVSCRRGFDKFLWHFPDWASNPEQASSFQICRVGHSGTTRIFCIRKKTWYYKIS